MQLYTGPDFQKVDWFACVHPVELTTICIFVHGKIAPEMHIGTYLAHADQAFMQIGVMFK